MVVYLAYLEAGEEETTSFEKGECHCGVWNNVWKLGCSRSPSYDLTDLWRGKSKGPGWHINNRDERIGNHIKLNLSLGRREEKSAEGWTFGTRRLELEQSVPTGSADWGFKAQQFGTDLSKPGERSGFQPVLPVLIQTNKLAV
jgi:hypothetical protein